jgi:hypothetical protein
MFPPEEKDRVVGDVREWVAKAGGNTSKEGCWAAFINRVRDNLHVVLALSPVGEAFRARWAVGGAGGSADSISWGFMPRVHEHEHVGMQCCWLLIAGGA